MYKKLFCFKKNADAQTISTTTTYISSELDKLNLTEERLKRYVDEANVSSSTTITTYTGKNADTTLRAKAAILREKAVSKTLDNIKNLMNVDICFVLDCTKSMRPHIAAAKDCILQVSNYVKSVNPNIKFRVGFCGYRDHYNGSDRLEVFDFTKNYERFTKYLRGVSPIPNRDYPEDVLGGLDAAITQMDWQNGTRVLFHIGDYPPHGRRFHNLGDNYPDGDPNGLTAESVLEKMKSKNILYFFGRITHHTDKMIQIFRDIIGEFPVFDLVGGDPIKLIDKFSNFFCVDNNFEIKSSTSI